MSATLHSSSPTFGGNLSGFEQTVHPMLMLTAKEALSVGVLVVFAVFLVLETLFPYRKALFKTLINSYLTNSYTFIFNNIILSSFSLTSLFFIAQNLSHLGLLSGLSNHLVKWAISFILLDLTVYLWHRANHTFSCLWRFHKVHHSDNSLNVSTAIRFHMGELFLTVWVKSAFIIVVGIEAEVVLVNELVITLFVVFHHANISFKGEQFLSKLIIVPRLHRTHHSARRVEENSNYGIVFSVWDRAFGTIKEVVPERVGLRNVRDQNFLELLKFGFTTEPKLLLPQGHIISAPWGSHCEDALKLNLRLADRDVSRKVP